MKDKIEIEDFKYTVDRIKTLESRYYQVLIFCISAIGVVLGFSDKIPELVPLILTSILWISAYLGLRNRRYQGLDSAYLFKNYYKKYNHIAHDSFYNYHVRSLKKKRESIFIRKLYYKITGFLSNPFFVLLVVTIIFEAYFWINHINQEFRCHPILIILYFLFISILNLSVLLSIMGLKKYNYFYFQSLWKKFVKRKRIKSQSQE
jgi:hypothetical protein